MSSLVVPGQSPDPPTAESQRSPDNHDAVKQVNWLLEALDIDRESPVRYLRQCTSSLFVLLFQNLFSQAELPGITPEPDTPEKKLRNLQIVLTTLEGIFQQSLGDISGEKIMAHDEDHISRLVHLFVKMVETVLRHRPQHDSENSGDGATDDDTADDETTTTASGSSVGEPDGHQPHLRPVTKQSRLDSLERVATWQRTIVHPQGAQGRPSTAAVLSLMHERLRSVDEAHGASGRGKVMSRQRVAWPSRHLDVPGAPAARRADAPQHRRKPQHNFLVSRYELFGSSPRGTLDSARRDEKIERLRCERLVEAANYRAHSTSLRENSQRQAALRQQVRMEMRQQRDYFIGVARQAKEDDNRLRQIYCDAVDSARYRVTIPSSASRQTYVIRKAVSHAETEAASLLTERLHAADDAYKRYNATLKVWRKDSRLFKATLA